MTLIDPGRPAPEFTLRDQAGKTRSLSDYRGRTVVLYFYPEDDTDLCTSQACQFRDHHPDFSKIKAVIIGISPQSVDSKRIFAEKHALPFVLLADDTIGRDGPETCAAYGVWREKNMYGKLVRGMVRTTYLIGPDGVVVRRWDHVKTPGHAAAVLAAVKTFQHGAPRPTLLEPKPRPFRPAKPRRKNRTQAGHPGYSGVVSTRGKQTRNRSMAAQARTVKSRGKR